MDTSAPEYTMDGYYTGEYSVDEYDASAAESWFSIEYTMDEYNAAE